MNALENEADLRATTLGLLHKDRQLVLPYILLDRRPALPGVEPPPLLLGAQIDPPETECEGLADRAADQFRADLLHPVLWIDPDRRHPGRVLGAILEV